ncbi:relaxase/mobilization nuclease domain-containing protein [Rhodophyticola sp.]|uniref:relaxase/mobilization nuclease domain-containing protein n=1 Tax=Rhodophyticola sp. TaxID=2680032 RepID=UPI003D296355
MRLNDAVDAVTGEVFRDGWSRIRGSMQGLHVAKQTQLVRAAAGHRPAVFKAIRSGGTHAKSQLANQLEYLTTKSTHIVDSSGFLDGKAKLEAGEIKDLTARFAKRWDAGFKPKLGQTTHLLMSFPMGTRGEDVRDIATDVAERFFQTDEGHFDYIIAVHEDRDHLHAHLVLNRRSQEGSSSFWGATIGSTTTISASPWWRRRRSTVCAWKPRGGWTAGSCITRPEPARFMPRRRRAGCPPSGSAWGRT